MTSLHQFQRYSQPENVATNNTLQLISRIYSFSPIKAKYFLSRLLDVELDIGLDISQQKRGKSSIPDGCISQQPFRIFIETKQDTGLYQEQLLRHCDSFLANQMNVLVALTVKPLSDAETAKIAVAIKEKGKDINFRAITFRDVCQVALEDIKEFEYELSEMVADYRDFCADHGLLPDDERTMRVVPTGNSFGLNMKHRVYYDIAGHGYSAHEYIGFYTDKSIRAVMKVDGVFDVDVIDGKISSCTEVIGSIAEFTPSIMAIIEESQAELGWDIKTGYRFFCTRSVVPTDFRKASKYGIMGKRFLNLDKIGVKATDTAEIAEQLKGMTWT